MSPHPLEVGLTMSVAEQVAGSHVNREHTVENDAPDHRGRYLSLSRWRAVGHLRDSFTLVGVPDGWMGKAAIARSYSHNGQSRHCCMTRRNASIRLHQRPE